MDDIRQFSRVVFGNRHTLEVLAAIGGGERHFYVQQLTSKTGIPSQTIRPIVKSLEGPLATALPSTGPRAPHYFERVDHPIWQMSIDLLEALRQDVSAR